MILLPMLGALAANRRRSAIVPPVGDGAYNTYANSLNPIIYWRLGENTTDTVANDSSGYGNNGVYGTGADGSSVPGLLPDSTNRAFKMIETIPVSSRGVTRDVCPFDTSRAAWTFAVIVKPDAVAESTILQIGSAAAGQQRPDLGMVVGADSDHYKLRVLYSGVAQLFITTQEYLIGEKHHAVLRQDTNGIQLFVDGTMVGSTSSKFTTGNTGTIRLGKANHAGSDQYPWHGVIDEATFFDYALSDAQIAEWAPMISDPAVDPYFDQVGLLLHFDGPDLSTSFPDVKGHTMTGVGSALINGNQLLLSPPAWVQTTERLEDFQFGTEDFTIEGKFRTVQHSGVIVDHYDPNVPGSWQIYLNASGQLSIYTSSGVLLTISKIGGGQLIDDLEHDFAFCRVDGTLYGFLEGVQRGWVANTTDFSAVVGCLSVGAQVNVRDSDYDFVGKINEVRVTKGVGRYSADYTPVARFPDQGPPVESSAYDEAVLDDTPLAYWKLDETTGTVMVDSSGNARNGVYAPAVTLDQAPLIQTGRAVAVAGSNVPAMTVPFDSALFLAGQHTIELWIATTATQGAWLLSNANASIQISGYIIEIDGQGKVHYSLWQTGSNDELISDAAYNDGQPHHIVARFETGNMSLTVDKVVKSKTTSAAFANDRDLSIGYANANSPLATFNGKIDAMALYGTKLSDARVNAHYDIGHPAEPSEWNPADKAAGVTVNGSIASGSGSGSVRGMVSRAHVTDERRHFEVTVLAAGVPDTLYIGLMEGDDNIALAPGRTGAGYGYSSGGTSYVDGSTSGGLATYTTGDVIGVVRNGPAGSRFDYYKNGVIQIGASGVLDAVFPAVGGVPSSAGWSAKLNTTGPFSFAVSNSFAWEEVVPTVGSKWNPADMGSRIVLSNDDRTAKGDQSTMVRGVQGHTSGKWQFEVIVNSPGLSDSTYIGMAATSAPLNTAPGTSPGAAAIAYRADGTLWWDVTSNFPGRPVIGTGDVITVIADLDALECNFYRNGTPLLGGLNMATALFTAGMEVKPAVGGGGSGAEWRCTLRTVGLQYPVAGYAEWDDQAPPQLSQWNPAKKGSSVVLSNNDRSAEVSLQDVVLAKKANTPFEARMFEITIDRMLSQNAMVGLARDDINLSIFLGAGSGGWGYIGQGGLFAQGAYTPGGPSFQEGDIMGVRIDSSGQCLLYRNGTYIQLIASGFHERTVYPAASSGDGGGAVYDFTLNTTGPFAFPAEGFAPWE